MSIKITQPIGFMDLILCGFIENARLNDLVRLRTSFRCIEKQPALRLELKKIEVFVQALFRTLKKHG